VTRPCPKCGGADSYKHKRRAKYTCKACTHQFSETSKTPLHSRKMPLEKYTIAFDAFRNGSTAVAVSKLIDCNYRTAWRLRRVAIQTFEEARRGNASFAT
jgi:transposase-like protein